MEESGQSELKKQKALRSSISAFSDLGNASQLSDPRTSYAARRSSAPPSRGGDDGGSDLGGSTGKRRNFIKALFQSDSSMKEDPLMQHAPAQNSSFWAQYSHNAVKGGAERKADEVYMLFVRDTYVFEPRSKQLLTWLVFVLVVTLYASVETPVEIAWYSSFSEFSTSAFFLCSNIIVSCVFMLDILVNFNTAFVDYTGGRGLVSRRLSIVTEYSKLWLWIDLLATIPFDVIFRGSNAQLLRLLKLLRLLRIFKLMLSKRLLRVVEGTYSVDYDQVNLSLFLFLVLLVMHIMGCCLFIVSSFYGGRHLFLSENGLTDEPIGGQYILGMYWAAMTVSTIGYGDVAITSNSLRVYVTLCMLIGASFYAYIVGSLVQIIMNMSKRENERRQALAAANAMTSEAALPTAARRRIRAFFSKTSAGSGNGISLKEHQDCFERMSPPMAAAFARHVLSDWLPHVKWLQSEDNNFIVDFTALLGEQSFAPREPVTQRSAVAATMYIIRGGSVMLVGPGYVFANHRGVGEEILLPGRQSYGYDCYSSSYVDCWSLDRDEFHDLVQRYPKMLPRVRWAALAVVVKRRDGRVTLKAAAAKDSKDFPKSASAADAALTEASDSGERYGGGGGGVTTLVPAAAGARSHSQRLWASAAANGEAKEAAVGLDGGGSAASAAAGSGGGGGSGGSGGGSDSLELATALQDVLRRSLRDIEAVLQSHGGGAATAGRA